MVPPVLFPLTGKGVHYVRRSGQTNNAPGADQPFDHPCHRGGMVLHLTARHQPAQHEFLELRLYPAFGLYPGIYDRYGH